MSEPEYECFIISGGFSRHDGKPICEDEDDLGQLMLDLALWFEERGYCWMAAGKPSDPRAPRKR